LAFAQVFQKNLQGVPPSITSDFAQFSDCTGLRGSSHLSADECQIPEHFRVLSPTNINTI
jgi:hypothetical protein